jgi:PilZ domain-containing protein
MRCLLPWGRTGLRAYPALFFLEIPARFGPHNGMPSESHMRRHARLPFDAQMQVSWKDARGQVQNLRAKCLDLSAEGVRLETDTPIPARTSVTLQSPRYGGLGTASVRHCVRRALKYSVGLEFTSLLALAGSGRKRCLDEIQSAAGSPL